MVDLLKKEFSQTRTFAEPLTGCFLRLDKPPNSEKKSVAVEGAEICPLEPEVVFTEVGESKSSVYVKREP